MFYLHMAPPVPTTASGATTTREGNTDFRYVMPSRPKSATPAIRVPTVAPTTIAVVSSSTSGGSVSQPRTTAPLSRATAYIGFSPRLPSASRPAAPPTTPTIARGNLQHVLHTHRASASPRRLSFGAVNVGKPDELVADDTTSTNEKTSPLTTSMTTGNVYHVMTARKSAEETAKQLARRIAHYRAQEEKVLREVHQMKQRLENMIAYHEATETPVRSTESADTPSKSGNTLKRPVSATTQASRMAQRNDVKTPRSREQLQFLTKQRRVIQYRNSEAARQQKEKRQAALEMHRQKDAAEQTRRTAIKERIRQERQLAIDQRAARQHQLLETLEQQHHARLRQEQARELEAKQRVNDMREEERNLALRLQALQVHQEHIKRGLDDTLQNPRVKRPSPPRPRSARATASTLRQAGPQDCSSSVQPVQ